jgi:hypothetical protein
MRVLAILSVACAQTERGVLRSQLAKLSGGEDPSKSSELNKALELMDTNSDGKCRNATFAVHGARKHLIRVSSTSCPMARQNQSG